MRIEKTIVPPHLAHMNVCAVMETFGRERRLRNYTVEAFRQMMIDTGQSFDQRQYPPLPPQAGQWADLSFRHFYPSMDAHEEYLWSNYTFDIKKESIVDSLAEPTRKRRAVKSDESDGDSGVRVVTGKRTRGPNQPKLPGFKPKKAARPLRSPPPSKPSRLPGPQIRGRPRKYIHVVSETGQVLKNVIPSIAIRPELPHVLIYSEDRDLLIAAPEDFSGVGQPPALTEADLENSWPPSFFQQFPAAVHSKIPKNRRKKGPNAHAIEGIDQPAKAGPSKRKKKASLAAAASDTDAQTRRSKRARRETNYTDQHDESEEDEAPKAEEDELDESETGEEDEPTDQGAARPTPAQQHLDAILTVMQQALEHDPPGAAPPLDPLLDDSSTPAVEVVGDEGDATVGQEAAGPSPIAEARRPASRRPQTARAQSSHAADAGRPADLAGPSRQKTSANTIPPEAFEASRPAVAEAEPSTPARPPTAPGRPLPDRELSSRQDEESNTVSTPAIPLTLDGSGTPAQIPSITTFTPAATQRGRFDLGAIRRANEIIQALTEAGGVSTEIRLREVHTEWTKRAVGTDTPHAPPVAYLMDRKTCQRALNTCLDDGRLRQTKSSAPSTHGKWVQHTVVYLRDLPQETFNTFLRELAVQTMKAMTPSRKAPPTIMPSSPFTEVIIPAGQGPAASKFTPIRTSLLRASTTMTPREALLRDHLVVSYLYGFQSGRYLRLKRLHTAICQALRKPIDSTNIASRSPRVFAFPLCFEDLTISDFLSLITYTKDYDAEVERFVTDSATKNTLLRDVPRSIWPEKTFGKADVSKRFRRLLQMMQELKLLTPLAKTEGGEGSFKTDDGESFVPIEDISSASWFVMHDLAPVYQLGSSPPPLLGLLPTQTEEELQTLWDTIERVAIGRNAQSLALPRQHTFTGLPQTAQLEGVLQLSQDSLRSLRSRSRWQNEIKLDVIQRSALDSTINWKTAERTLTDDAELSKLAYDYALPLHFVRDYLHGRLEVARDRLWTRAKVDEAVKRGAEEKARKSEAALRRILTERRRDDAEAFKARVVAAAERSIVPFENDMIRYVHFQQNFSTRKQELTDAMLDQFIYLFKRSKDVGTGPQPERAWRALRKAPISRRSRREEKEAQKQGQNRRLFQPGRRGRKRLSWSAAEDELMVECEVIFRVRAGRRPGQPTKDRTALEKLMPHRSEHAIKDRVRKLVNGHEGLWQYLHEIEQSWRPIWLKLRGTKELPDPHPQDPADFDLQRHVDVFRQKVPLAPWRQAALAAARGLGNTTDLPGATSDLYTRYRIALDRRVGKDNWSWEKMIYDEVTPEMSRWGALSSTSMFVPDVPDPAPTKDPKVCLAEATLRTIYNTPTKAYDTAAADAMTDDFKAGVVNQARTNMTLSKVLLSRKGFSVNPRDLAFASTWHGETDGPLRADLQAEFSAFDDQLCKFADKDDWPQEVSLVADGGAVAEMMELVSSNRVSFDFDPKEFPTVKWCNDAYNTRRFNDDSFEYPLQYQVSDLAAKSAMSSDSTRPSVAEQPRNTLWQEHSALLHPTEQVLKQVRVAIGEAGANGITRYDLAQALDLQITEVDSTLAVLAGASTTEIFWTGYDTARVVSADFWHEYTIPQRIAKADPSQRSPGEPTGKRFSPRRWFDMLGELVEGDWEKCLKCVKGHVMSRPGLTEVRLT